MKERVQGREPPFALLTVVRRYSGQTNGNMTTRTASGSTYTLGYDAENRLTSVSGAATAQPYPNPNPLSFSETNRPRPITT